MESKGYLSRTNLEYLEEIYSQFLANPDQIDQDWARFFEGIEFAKSKGLDQVSEPVTHDESKIQDLIKIYRDYGHLNAKLDPLNLSTKQGEFKSFKDLDLASIDQSEKFEIAARIRMEPSTLAQIVDRLEKNYCGPIALEAGECAPSVRRWFIDEFEDQSFELTNEEKVTILKQLARTESLEKFIHTRYVGTKRFSIEGCDALIPMLEYLVEKGSNEHKVEELVIGMAHRGRVNVLANFMNKALEVILAEFNGHMGAEDEYDADVKYHMGFSADKKTMQGKDCHVSLAFNPSHLEAVSAVACGMTRAKQRQRKDTENREKVLPVLIHGDASVIGQGVVAENFQLSQLKGYTVGGSLHIVMNNQVGFTTNPSDARSTDYASDIAKAIKAPVILVNADHPEACIKAVDMALRFRQEFKQDVVIDLIGYRRFGHNEGDEPAFTQPVMYSKIKKHPTAYNQYAKRLGQEGVFSTKESDAFFESKMENLQAIYENIKKNIPEKIKPPAFGGVWEGLKWATADDLKKDTDTSAKEADLKKVIHCLTHPPKSFNVHKKIQKLLKHRQEMFDQDKMDWGTVELLCYGSLVLEGTPVRLSGQDSERGTFTHRHSVYYDAKTAERYSPLSNLREDKEFCVYNSPLSEMAVLGFEYGNSISDPSFLTLWEAQFGDFANGAQIIIDQFISSGESKWYRSNGLVLLLPHGYEGQGPEHSSARLERFLQLCAQDNMQVCNFTTPAQLFHALRRQVKRNFRKPLVVMSPKSLLRHPKVVSTKADLITGSFQEVLGDAKNLNAKRVILCSGKIYYDLLARQEETETKEVALIRIEQLYPFPDNKLAEALSQFKLAKDFVWAQEEPQNMGAYWFIAPKLKRVLQMAGKEPILYYAGRTERASPATGSPSVHQEEQNDIINSCFNLNS